MKSDLTLFSERALDAASPPHPDPLPQCGRGNQKATGDTEQPDFCPRFPSLAPIGGEGWGEGVFRIGNNYRPLLIVVIVWVLSLVFAASPLKAADDTNSSSGLDYNSFDIISKRNIFSPSRYRPTRNDGPRVRIDSFTLVGTMSYEKGQFAFFDGTSSEYRKTLKPADTIAGYRISQITPNSITLLAGENKVINLAVGAQMKRQDGGPWSLLSHAEPIASSNPGEPADFSAKAANLNGAESDALKRLMMRRLKEQ